MTDPLTAPRFQARLNQVLQAEHTGYVSICFAPGRPGVVELVAGPQNPPTQVLSQMQGGPNAYAGGVIRRGEFWTARAERDVGVTIVFTPFA